MKLKPCPFCGFSRAKVMVDKDKWCTIGTVTCNICGAQVSGVGVMVGTVSEKELKAGAVKVWNTRPAPRRMKRRSNP